MTEDQESAIPVQPDESGEQEQMTDSNPSEPVAEETAGTDEAQTDDKGHEPPAWFQKRIDQLTREKYEARRQLEEAQKLIADHLKGDEGDRSSAPQDIDQLVNQRLSEVRFNDACNRVYQEGKKEFQDFDASLAAFQQLGGLPQEFLHAVVDQPDSHKLLYTLSKDLNEAYRILSLPAFQQGRELERLSAKAAKPSKPVSSAPAPISPVDGPARSDVDPSKLSMDEWVKWRANQSRS